MPLGTSYLVSYLKTNNKVGEIGILDYPLSIKDNANYADMKDYILGEACYG